ncbi:MAG: class I SAM-dependent methyltransferase [Flavobacteriaceae bacterium]|nr:class I SAM-dependent methyltransferase [Flavobacteriaceae bacterium]
MNIIDKFHNWRRKQRWNRQYKSGRWKNLRNDIERERYATIIDFITKYGNQNPLVLDLGCGEGILCKRMNTKNYKEFVGMDFSSESIKQANEKQLDKAVFKVADLHYFKPEQKYDVIVFNEAFYYVHDSEKAKVLQIMMDALTENGIIINSIYREGAGSWEYFEIDTLQQIDFKTVTTSEAKTYWKIGVYKKAITS